MAMLKIETEIDLNEWCTDAVADERITTLEEAIVDQLAKQSLAFVESSTREMIQTQVMEHINKLVPETVHKIVQEKMLSLMNEEFALKESYGNTPTFIGTMEDYIKKVIDSSLKNPVDHNGRALGTSCSTGETVMTHLINKEVSSHLRHIQQSLEGQVQRAVKERLAVVQKEAIVKALTTCGFNPVDKIVVL